MTPAAISIGTIEIHLLRDGVDRVPPDMILVGAPDEEIAAAVHRHADADGQLAVTYDGLLIRTAGRLVLVDAGFGGWGDDEGVGGKLLGELGALNVLAREIDEVVISHGHADHIGGLTTLDSDRRHVPVFTAARHWLWQDEWTYWTSDGALSSMPSSLADPARQVLPPIAAAGLLALAMTEVEVAPGVWIQPAAGHTPGHAVVRVESGGQSAIYAGDAIFHAVNVASPDWGCVFDVDRDAAASSRRRLLESASRDHSVVLAAHLGSPGRVEPDGRGYRFLPR